MKRADVWSLWGSLIVEGRRTLCRFHRTLGAKALSEETRDILITVNVKYLCSFEGRRVPQGTRNFRDLVIHSGGVPPVSISNTGSQTSRANDTWTAGSWEVSRCQVNKQRDRLFSCANGIRNGACNILWGRPPPYCAGAAKYCSPAQRLGRNDIPYRFVSQNNFQVNTLPVDGFGQRTSTEND